MNSPWTRQPVLGLDFGGVIKPRTPLAGSGDTQFGTPFLEEPPGPGAFATITELVDAFGGRVWIVSRAGPRVQGLTREWLDAWSFCRETGMPAGNIRFCRERADKEPICRKLGISHFVDDRLSVLQVLREAVPRLYLFDDSGVSRAPQRWMTRVGTWVQLRDAIVADVRPQASDHRHRG